MHLDWDSQAALVFKGLITLGATLGVWVTILIVKRWRDRPAVRRDPQATMRRRMPLFGPVAGVLIFLFGPCIGLIGTTQDADTDNGRAMMIAGPCMMLLGIILLVLYGTVYLDTSPTAFTLRGPLGRRRTIAYEDVATITDTVAWGTPLVQIRSRSGERIQGGPIMFDWHRYQRWQAERERRARVGGWSWCETSCARLARATRSSAPHSPIPTAPDAGATAPRRSGERSPLPGRQAAPADRAP